MSIAALLTTIAAMPAVALEAGGREAATMTHRREPQFPNVAFDASLTNWLAANDTGARRSLDRR